MSNPSTLRKPVRVTCYDQSLWDWERPYAGEGGGVDDESAPPTLVKAHVLQGHLSPLHHRHLQERTLLRIRIYMVMPI